MPNDYFNTSGYPGTRATGSSSSMRQELANITLAFDKLPTLTGMANRVVAVNSGGTALTAATSLNGISIGATTPASGAFTTLSATGAASLAAVTLTGILTAAVGAVGAPSLHFGDSTSGLYRPASNQIGVTISGTQRFVVGSSGATVTGGLTVTSTSTLAAATLSGVLTLPVGSESAPSVTVTGDTNTGLFWPGGDHFCLTTGGVERVRIDSSGRLRIGYDSTVTTVGIIPQVHVVGTSQSTGALGLATYAANNSGPAFIMSKSRSATPGSWSLAQGSDTVGGIYWAADDGAAFIRPAQIVCTLAGTPALNDMPGRLQFSVTSAGASTPTERFRLSSGGAVFSPGVAGDVPTNTHMLIERLANTPLPPALAAGTVLTLAGSSAPSSPAYLQIVSGNTGSCAVRFGDTDEASRGIFAYDHSTDAFVISTAGTAHSSVSGIGAWTLGQTSAGPARLNAYSTSSGASALVAYFANDVSGVASTAARLQLTTAGSSRGSYIEAINTTGASNAHDLILATNAASASPVERLRLTSDGRLYGTALHNNAGAVTGTTNQYIASGTYTPTLTNTTNVAASTAFTAQWIRVGNVVTVSGRVDIDPTSASVTTRLDLSLPIASNFTGGAQAAGTSERSGSTPLGAYVASDSATDTVGIVFNNDASTGNSGWYYHFTYVVV